MTTAQYFGLLAAIYLAPGMTPWVRVVFGILAGVIALYAMAHP